MCKVTKPLTDFVSFKAKGKRYYRGKCRPCLSAHRKEAWSSEWSSCRKSRYRNKKDGPCVDCGVSFPSYVMQFDHVRGDKLIKVSDLSLSSDAVLVTEIAKCDLVCGNCHKIRTHTRRVGQHSEAHLS